MKLLPLHHHLVLYILMSTDVASVWGLMARLKATPTSSTSASVAAATALTPAPYSYAAGATATPPTLGLVKLEQKSGDQYMSSDGTPQRFSYLFSESSAASAPITAQVTGTPEHDNYNYYEEYDYRVSLINFSPSIRYNIICMCM